MRVIPFLFILSLPTLAAAAESGVESRADGKRVVLVGADCEAVEKSSQVISKMLPPLANARPKEKTGDGPVAKRTSQGCELDVTDLLPPAYHQKMIEESKGPNCWGYALFANELIEKYRYADDKEFGKIIGSPLCRELRPKEKIQAGDIGAIRTNIHFPGRPKGAEHHGFVYLDEGLTLTKNGGSGSLRIQAMEVLAKWWDLNFERAHCRRVTGVPDDCDTWVNVFRCRAKTDEIATFQKAKLAPLDLLLAMYKQARVLALGESNHAHFQSYDYLVELLNKVGTDPKLKFIATEAPFKIFEFFKRESIKAASEHPFEYGDLKDSDYLRLRLFPLIREINKKRPANNPLLMVGIDGYPLENREGLPENDQSSGTGSWDREDATRRNFQGAIIDGLEKDQKVIIYYHLFHLIQGVSGRLPRLNREKKIWEDGAWAPFNWFGLWLAKNAWRDKTKIVVFDEPEGSWAPQGTFLLGQRLALLNAFEPYGVKLEEVGKLSKGRGFDLIMPGTMFKSHYDGQVRSDAALGTMADGLIWFPEAKHKDYRILGN